MGVVMATDPASTLRRNPAGSPSGRIAAIYAERMRSLGRRAKRQSDAAPRIPLATRPPQNDGPDAEYSVRVR
jgi:hypothetical protein